MIFFKKQKKEVVSSSLTPTETTNNLNTSVDTEKIKAVQDHKFSIAFNRHGMLFMKCLTHQEEGKGPPEECMDEFAKRFEKIINKEDEGMLK